MNFKRTYERQKHLLCKNAISDAYDVAMTCEAGHQYRMARRMFDLAELIERKFYEAAL